MKMKEKLKSRKLWLSIALFIFSAVVYYDTRDFKATYTAVIAVLSYVLPEGAADYAKINKIAETLENE